MELTNTQRKILEFGKKEFLAKSYQGASMRSVVREAGFTQGVFYGYYGIKEDLFDELVRRQRYRDAVFRKQRLRGAPSGPAPDTGRSGSCPGAFEAVCSL